MVLFLPPYERNGRDVEIMHMAAVMELSGGQRRRSSVFFITTMAL
jgi:hypothetical protein